jgi:equilibrative nucleoside transporter 1/2/3
VFLQIKWHCINVCGVFVVTLAVFPGIVTEIPSTTGLHNGWFPIMNIAVFDVADFLGKYAPEHFFVEDSGLSKWVLCRAVFVPLFVICRQPKLLVHDGWAVGFTFLMGLSNGYLGTLTMMYGPMGVAMEDKETAGYVMVWCLMLGLSLGAGIGVILTALV